ncbi:uncharacterized protein SAPINGB_P000460 [Magnusiomyces paraingens]|uniref:Enoyl reductase (ER) domain-containing protein n=1 Tax=Magnusiomyces paraingens TaxID=2606893 RepID=A0A5E8B1A5_9ASCO|nr:uncharacterized protein SAPINGB_P000460 [Saprochaete ingens]VVT44570.1 unnamed protein product [Saprochaete ingens]
MSTTLQSKEVVYTSGIDSLKVIDSKVTLPLAPTQIAIKIHYVGINPVDYKLMGFAAFKLWQSLKGVGQEISGEIIHIGERVSKFKPGDRVCVLLSNPFQGGLKTYLVTTTADRILKIPDEMPYDQAASFMMSFGTAFKSLSFVDWAKLKDTPSSLLILGGSTNTGVFATQLAKKYFDIKTVAATCSAKSIPRVTSFGVNYTLDYTSKTPIAEQAAELVQNELAGVKFDMIFDCIGGTELFASISSILKPANTGAYYVTVVGDDPHFGLNWGVVTMISKYLFAKPLWGFNYKLYVLEGSEGFLDAAKKKILVPGSEYKIPIDTVYPWTEYKEALSKLMTHQAKGKIVLKVIEEEEE